MGDLEDSVISFKTCLALAFMWGYRLIEYVDSAVELMPMSIVSYVETISMYPILKFSLSSISPRRTFVNFRKRLPRKWSLEDLFTKANVKIQFLNSWWEQEADATQQWQTSSSANFSLKMRQIFISPISNKPETFQLIQGLST